MSRKVRKNSTRVKNIAKNAKNFTKLKMLNYSSPSRGTHCELTLLLVEESLYGNVQIFHNANLDNGNNIVRIKVRQVDLVA